VSARRVRDTQCCSSSDRKCCEQQTSPLQKNKAAEAPCTMAHGCSARQETLVCTERNRACKGRAWGPRPCMPATPLPHEMPVDITSTTQRHQPLCRDNACMGKPATCGANRIKQSHRTVEGAPTAHGHVQPTRTTRRAGLLRARGSQRHVCRALAQALCRL
jgi:hypothetical protein